MLKKLLAVFQGRTPDAPPLTAPPPPAAEIPTTPMQTALALKKQGDLAAAETLLLDIVATSPNHAEALRQLAAIAYATGRPEQAIAWLDRALAIQPQAESYSLRGNAWLWIGNLPAAEQNYRQALAIEPQGAILFSNLGNVQRLQGMPVEAAASCRQALKLKPDLGIAWTNLGCALLDLGDTAQARTALAKARALCPDAADVLYHQGTAWRMEDNLEAAADSFRQAMAMAPHDLNILNDLGNCLLQLGHFEEASGYFRECLRLDPDMDVAQDNLLYCYCFHPAITPQQYLDEARLAGERLQARATPCTQWPALNLSPPPLRVGLVSGDLRSHPVGYFLESIVRHLDPALVRLHAYTNEPPHDDPLTDRLRPFFASWTSIRALDDATASRRIQADGIHLLIDLAGHTALNRLSLFPWRAAPVQASWLGYFASTGVPGIDYFLADDFSVTEEESNHFSENIWRLPGSRLCFTAPEPRPSLEIRPAPCTTRGAVTFGCFQRPGTIHDGVLRVWGQILREQPQARLLLKNRGLDKAEVATPLLARLNALGVATRQILLEGESDREQYLQAYHQVDVMLDTWPFPGGTTTCEALWMGVPTLTLSGNNLLARQGAAMMACVGLEEWIASSEADYIQRALACAADPSALAQLRPTLRHRLMTSPLGDAAGFARHLEQAFLGMWRASRPGAA